MRAPISGRVGRLNVTAGNLVTAGTASPVLTTLVSVDPIYASFNVSEEVVAAALAKLSASAGSIDAIERIPVEIGTSADEGTPITGHIQLINNEVDAATGTIRVRAELTNADGRLIPGQFVRIRIGDPQPEEKLVISDRAVSSDQDKKFVLVVGADNKVEYRQVTLGPSPMVSGRGKRAEARREHHRQRSAARTPRRRRRPAGRASDRFDRQAIAKLRPDGP